MLIGCPSTAERKK